MNRFLLLLTFDTLLLSGCMTGVSSPHMMNRSGSYTPVIAPTQKGYRPVLPYFLAEVTFWHCESMNAAMLQNVRDHFAHPLGDGTYYQFIAAIVINGDYESVGTSFTIWLLDGRRLDSGTMFRGSNGMPKPSFKDSEIGQQMYVHALELLHSAIPKAKLQEAKKSIQANGAL